MKCKVVFLHGYDDNDCENRRRGAKLCLLLKKDVYDN